MSVGNDALSTRWSSAFVQYRRTSSFDDASPDRMAGSEAPPLSTRCQ